MVRHAKSSWENTSEISDIDRPLNVRGVKDAINVANYFCKKFNEVDFMLSSNADRALHTAAIFYRVLHQENKHFEVSRELYHPLAKDILGVLSKVNNDYNSVMLFSHNPGISDVVFEVKPDIQKVSTCSISFFTCNISKWEDIDISMLKFDKHISPKEIKVH